MKLVLHLFLVLILTGCSYQKAMMEPSETEMPVIRYVQVEVLYDYLLQHDDDALSFQKRSRELSSQIQEIEDQVLAEANQAMRKRLLENLEELKEKMSVLRSREASYREKILLQIEDAASDVAKRQGYHLLLGGGNTVIYSKKEYDITREVLRELASRRIRGAPVNR